MNNNRRNFIRNSGLVSLGFLGLSQFAANAASLGFIEEGNFLRNYGSLTHRQGDILSLPNGFTAKVISRKGDLMNDGFSVPGAFDGLGVFRWKNNSSTQRPL